MKGKTIGTVCVALGVVLIVSALGVTGSRLWKEQQAGNHAQQTMDHLLVQMSEQKKPATPDQPSIPLKSDELFQDPVCRVMPEVEIDGVSYIGYLSIPVLGLELPVISNSTEENLEIAPCRFYGTVYDQNFVIGGHRYRRHFRKLSTLGYGEALSFTDMEGNVYTYEVVEYEVLEPNQAEYLCSGEWDLSLFTCTPGGLTRVVLRCLRTEVTGV
jgi:sortase A